MQAQTQNIDTYMHIHTHTHTPRQEYMREKQRRCAKGSTVYSTCVNTEPHFLERFAISLTLPIVVFLHGLPGLFDAGGFEELDSVEL